MNSLLAQKKLWLPRALFCLLGIATLDVYSTTNTAKNITALWQLSKAELEHFHEIDWIKELMSGVNVNHSSDGNYEKYIPNSIIIISGAPTQKKVDYFRKLHEINYTFGIIHLSDEFYQWHAWYYGNAKFIFRNYWHKKFIPHKNIYTFPLGYKKEFWNNSDKKIPSAAQRNYTWSFAGQLTNKPTRQQMVRSLKTTTNDMEALATIPNYFIHETFNFGDPKGLNVSEYRNLLLKTIFVPCPTGWWNLDSFRLYEALECGCIPIVEKKPTLDYFAKFLGQHPFLTIESWDDAPQLMLDLLNDPERLEQRRLQCLTWWTSYKASMKKQFAQIVNNAFPI